VHAATRGLADARIVRPGASPVLAVPAHAGELVFGFLLDGAGRLEREDAVPLGPADSFVIPPGEPWRMAEMSAEFRLLLITTADLPG
jgi:mannose-6-phosphate isomerase-like protein (cupin superfamily)